MATVHAPLHRILLTSFADALERVPVALQKHGFGVLTSIDVQATLRAKVGANMAPYTILGACNPKLAHQALGLDPTIGVNLPCNVVVRELGENQVEVRCADPVETIGQRAALRDVAEQVRGMLAKVLADL